jgi:hypothetical protein
LKSQGVDAPDVIERVESQVRLMFSAYKSGNTDDAHRAWLSLGGMADRIMPMLKLLDLCSLENGYLIAVEMQSTLASSVLSRYNETANKLGLNRGAIEEVRVQAQLATMDAYSLSKRIARGSHPCRWIRSRR